MRPLRATRGARTGGLSGGPRITDLLRAAALAVTQPITLRLTSTTGPPGGKGTKSGTLSGPSVTTLLRAAALAVTQPITLRLTSTTGPPADGHQKESKAALRAMKRTQRLIRQSASQLRQAELETMRSRLRPVRRSLHTSRADLWRWYRATGRSWAQFVADHGPG